LSSYRPYRIVDDVVFDGTPVPGLRAEYFRRDLGDRVATVGLYRYVGRELFQAWGYSGEPSCRFSSLHDDDGDWEPAQTGGPQVRVLRDGRLVLGLAIRSVRGHWVVTMPLRAEAAWCAPPAPEPKPAPPPVPPKKHGPMVYPVGRKRRRRRGKN
jgi:hypothetical protein